VDSTLTERRGPWLSRAGWLAFNTLQLMFTLAWTGTLICVALLVRVIAGRRLPLRMASRLWAPGLLAGAGARLQVEGGEHIDWSRPYVLVSNHQSMIDICVLFRAVPVPLRFVLKRELGAVPLLGAYARAMGMVFIDRGDARRARATLQQAAGVVREGASVVAFAEGSRSRDGRVGAFKGGAFQLAIDAGVPVLPVAISGTGAVLPKHGFAVRPGPIRLRFGTPIDTAGANRHRLAEQTRAAVVALLER
jgi:1-acyl-sn-glycerol-3-phosphate acyltransferase